MNAQIPLHDVLRMDLADIKARRAIRDIEYARLADADAKDQADEKRIRDQLTRAGINPDATDAPMAAPRSILTDYQRDAILDVIRHTPGTFADLGPALRDATDRGDSWLYAALRELVAEKRIVVSGRPGVYSVTA